MPQLAWWVGYVVAVAGVAVAALVRYALANQLGSAAPLLPFTVAVLAAGVAGGWKPAAFATALSAVVGPLLFADFDRGPRARSVEAVRLALFVGVGACIAGLCEVARAYRTLSTEQRKALAEAEEYRGIVEEGAAYMCRFAVDGTLTFVNEAYCKCFGRTRGELLGTKFVPLVPVADRPLIEKLLAALARGAVVYTHEHRVILPDGRVRWHRWTNRALPGTTGALQYQALGIDITERREAEEGLRELSETLERRVEQRTAELREREHRFRAIFHAQFEFIGLMTTDGTLIEANRTALASAGVREADVLGAPFWETAWWAHDAEQQERLKAAVARAANGEQDRFEAHHPTGDGARVWVDFSLTPFRDDTGRVVLLIPEGRDITARKRAETALRESEERFRAFMDHLPLAAWATDERNRLVLANRFLARMLNREPHELLGRTRHELLDAASAAAHEVTDGRVRAAGAALELQENYARPDGTPGVTHSVKFPVRGADGGTLVGGVALDVTDRTRAEAALRASEELYRSVVESLAEGVVVQDAARAIVACNDRACAALGLTRDQMTGRTSSDPRWRAVREDGSPLPNDEHPNVRVLRTGLPVFDAVMGVHTPDGELRWLKVNAVPVYRDGDGPGPATVASFHDITAARALDERVRASLREKELLLKEIHHRVKNNLQIVSTLLDLQSGFTADRAALALFAESRGRVRSMALVHERLYKSHDVARVDFADYARQLAEDLFRAYRASDEDVRLDVTVTAPPLPLDVAIPCGLLLNELMSNCFKHAFAGGRAGGLRVSLRAEGGARELVVADDGPGLPPGFDFRNGTSFGLQLVCTLVEQLNGTIEVRGPGAAFVVRF
jgi:PAS domain S-box-containing protein